MGDSLPPPAEFDLVDSFARLRGADVEIVLAEPKTELLESTVTVRLRQGARSADGTGEVTTGPTGRRLTVRIPRADLADGIWSLQVRRGDDTVAPLAARLLVQGRRPVVLLWGAKGNASATPKPQRRDAVARVASVGGRALDRALTVLPDERARQVRGQARKAARRLLSHRPRPTGA
jgi:hypothetical protein